MKEYMKPIIDLLLFDEEEVLTNSGVSPPSEQTRTYATYELNDVLMGDENRRANGTTTITIEKIAIN